MQKAVNRHQTTGDGGQTTEPSGYLSAHFDISQRAIGGKDQSGICNAEKANKMAKGM